MLLLHKEAKNLLHFTKQGMCKGREPERNVRGRVMSFAKFKNKSKLADYD